MKVDMHFHVTGNGTDLNNIDRDIYFKADDNNHWLTRILYNLVEKDLGRMGADFDQDGKITTKEYFRLAYRTLTTSEEIDTIVLLALDALYFPGTGKLDRRRTDLWVSNLFLSRKVKELNRRLSRDSNPENRGKRFFWGASVSPNRKDWKEELEFVLAQPDAVLMKLIPSTQHIDLADDRHRDFFRILAANDMPLLCHVGPEYAFHEGIRQKRLDSYRKLEKPLRQGVTVIAAHCATPVFPLIDRNEFKKFFAFMKKANSGGNIRLWGDTSAFSLSTRVPILPEIVKTVPPSWLVNGSDFPIPIDGWIHLPWITHDMTPEEYIRIFKTKNPLDKDVRIKRAHGFSDAILGNARKVLRIPS